MTEIFGIDLNKGYYAILEVSKGADAKELKAGFRRTCRKYHPDTTELKDLGKAADNFIEVNIAYEILSNPEKRGIYDAMLEAGREGAGETVDETPVPEEAPEPEMSIREYVDLLVEIQDTKGLRDLAMNEEYPREDREVAGFAYVEIEDDKQFLIVMFQARWVPESVKEAAGLKYVELEEDAFRLIMGVHKGEFSGIVEEAAGLRYVELEDSDSMLQSVAKHKKYLEAVREAAGIKYVEQVEERDTLGSIFNNSSFPQAVRDVAAIKYSYTGDDKTFLPYLTQMLQYGKLRGVAKEAVGLMCVELEDNPNQLTWYIQYEGSPHDVRKAAALKYVDLEDEKGQLIGILNNDDFLPLVKAAGIKVVELETLEIELDRMSKNAHYPKIVREAAARKLNGEDIGSLRKKHDEFIKQQRNSGGFKRQRSRRTQKAASG